MSHIKRYWSLLLCITLCLTGRQINLTLFYSRPYTFGDIFPLPGDLSYSIGDILQATGLLIGIIFLLYISHKIRSSAG